MKRWYGLVLVLVVLAQSGCTLAEDLLHMQPLRVVAHEPAHRFVAATHTDVVAVVFSRPVHRVHTEHAFSLEDSRGGVTGRFAWNRNGNRLEFRPHHGFQPGETYTTRVSTTAEDRRGNALNPELLFTFLLRSHDTRPTVVDEAVTVGATGELFRVEIEFSRPMARDSMIMALSTTPSFRFTIQWLNDDHRFVVTPSEPLLPGTSYTITVAASATCRDGNALTNDHLIPIPAAVENLPEVVSVTTDPGGITLGDDSHSQEATTGVTTAVEATDRFVLRFAAPVPVTTRLGLAQFAPHVPAVLEWNTAMDVATVRPRQPLVLGQRYELRVLERRFPFLVTGPIAPSLSGLAFSAHLGEEPLLPVADGATLTLIPGAPLVTRTDHAVVDVRITHHATSAIPMASFLQSLRFAARNGTFSFIVRAVERDPPDSPLLAAETATPATARDTVLRVYLTINRTGIEPFDLVLMELRAGLTDDHGNRLAANEGRLINAR